MKKVAVMAAITTVRDRCERANACLRQTANVADLALQKVRPTTEQERIEFIMGAWLYAHDARMYAEEAAKVALQYALQNGVTIDQLDAYVARLRQAA